MKVRILEKVEHPDTPITLGGEYTVNMIRAFLRDLQESLSLEDIIKVKYSLESNGVILFQNEFELTARGDPDIILHAAKTLLKERVKITKLIKSFKDIDVT